MGLQAPEVCDILEPEGNPYRKIGLNWIFLEQNIQITDRIFGKKTIRPGEGTESQRNQSIYNIRWECVKWTF